MSPTSKALLKGLLYGFLIVLVLSAIGLFVPAFHFPLMPGIALAGILFSSGVESDHRLRFEVASIVFNTLLYGLAIFFLFLMPRRQKTARVRRTPGRL